MKTIRRRVIGAGRETRTEAQDVGLALRDKHENRSMDTSETLRPGLGA